MSAANVKSGPYSGAKHKIVLAGFSHPYFRCYSATLNSEIDDHEAVAAADVLSVFDRCADSKVSLVVVAAPLCEELVKHQERLRAAFPDVQLCVSFDSKDGGCDCRCSVATQESRISVLAMDLRLDIWIAAIRLMLSGGRYVQPEILGTQDIKSQRPARSKSVNPENGEAVEHLTPRENEVLALVADGHQNKIIADRLRLSEHTIKLHMHHIFTKLGVTNRTQAAALYRNVSQVPRL